MKGRAELPTGEFNAEARQLVRVIKESGNMHRLREKDHEFVMGLNPDNTVTRKMLFWLRDIRDRCL